MSQRTTIAPTEGQEREYFSDVDTVTVALAPRTEDNRLPSNVWWSQSAGKVYSLSSLTADGTELSVLVRGWSNAQKFLCPKFTNIRAPTPLSLPCEYPVLQQYVTRDGRTVEPNQSLSAHERQRRRAGLPRESSAGASEIQPGSGSTELETQPSTDSQDPESLEALMNLYVQEGDYYPPKK